jgi:hypothetical protein
MRSANESSSVLVGSLVARCAACVPVRTRSEVPVHGRRDGGRFDTLAIQELLRILRAVDPSWLDLDSLESALRQFLAVLRLLQRAGCASDPRLDATADRRGHLAPDDDIRNSESAIWSEPSERLGEHAVFVGRQVDDAVGKWSRPPSCSAAG